MDATSYWIRSEVNQEEKTNTIWYHLHVESKIRHKMNICTKQKQTHSEKRPVVAQGAGEGKGRTGDLGLTDANYCV